MGRDKGKGKKRGGGKMFVANIEELQMREAQVEEAKAKRKNRRGDSDDEGDNDSDEEEVEVTTKDDLRELANFERAARLQKAGGEQNDDEEEVEEEKPRGLLRGMQTVNANHGSKNPKQMKTKDMLKNMENESAAEPQLSRREREALEAQKRKADYDRRHAAGETAEAKADMARLAEVRKRREEAKIKREKDEARQKLAEAGLPPASDDDDDDSDSDEEEVEVAKPKISAEKKAKNLAKKKAAMKEDDSDDIPVLSSIEIKKLKPDMLKEHLKKRGLSLQGQKKELITRLTDHEAGRK